MALWMRFGPPNERQPTPAGRELRIYHDMNPPEARHGGRQVHASATPFALPWEQEVRQAKPLSKRIHRM